MREIRMGIIGAGVISHRHMTTLKQIPQFKVVAVCDIDKKKLDAWGEKYGIPEDCRYTDYKDLLARDDIESVDVCVHNNLHVPLSIAAMKAGKHVYCEKPMAGSYADAKLLYDAQKVYGKKLAIQLSSIMNLQSRMARDMVKNGDLGHVYHARSVGFRRIGRPGLDMKSLSPDFYSGLYAGHGALFDMGVYHIAQLLFIMGIPKLESVYGSVYQEVEIDPRLLGDHTFDVEDLGVGMAKYQGGITLDIIEPWAINIDEIGSTFVAGSKGGLKIINVDAYGGQMANPQNFNSHPEELKFCGFQNGRIIDSDLQVHTNSRREVTADPSMMIFNDNHMHWLAYLSGELTDETRYDTPWLALQTMLVSEGIFLSSQLGRSVTADEIEAMSQSTALRKQETEWGTFEYDF